jgi:carboxymethylenebutenolidase
MFAMTVLTLHTQDGEMAADLAEPVTPNGAGVVVIQEAFGLTGYVRSVAERLAAAGFLAVAPHLFHRSGDPVIDYADFSAAAPHMSALTADGIATDLDAAIDALTARGVPPRRIGIIGFCMGGSVALVAATRPNLGAAVTFYGGGIRQGRMGLPPLLDVAPTLAAPWLGQYGDDDPSIPVDQVEDLRSAASRAGVTTEIVRYPGAGHAFHCDERPAAYRPEAAAQAWQRALDWFRRYLVAPDVG